MLALTDSALAPPCHLRRGPGPIAGRGLELARFLSRRLHRSDHARARQCAGFAIVTPERMVAGGRAFEVVRMKITEAGRRVLG